MTAAGITFAEQTEVGNINITTVFSDYVGTASRRFIAVQSRHISALGPFPSQYHGTCSILA